MILVYGPEFHAHKPWFDHPESPKRLELAYEALSRYGIIEQVRLEAPSTAQVDVLHKVHYEGYVRYVLKIVERAPAYIDPDTYVCKDTMKAALSAVGSSMRAAEEVFEGKDACVMVLCRPPGHHAGRAGKAMGAPTNGFCIFNNAAFAVLRLRELAEGGKVLVLDFDSHHGNGTHEVFYEEPNAIIVDLHQDPRTLYPWTGYPSQCGKGKARGTKINILLPRGSGDDVFLKAVEVVLNVYDEVSPEYVVVSAGFDPYLGDGLADLRVTSKSFNALGRILARLDSRIVVVLEGGYTSGMSRGLPAFISGLLGLSDPVGDEPTSSRRRVHELFEDYLREVEEYTKIPLRR